MESDIRNYQETPQPYWASEAYQVPSGLQPLVFAAGSVPGDRWLILPDDGMDLPDRREYALRSTDTALDVCVVSHADGSSSHTRIHSNEVTSIEIFNALLHCELVLHRRNAAALRIPYNGVADSKMRQLLAPVFHAAFSPSAAVYGNTLPRLGRMASLMRFWLGGQTSCVSAATPTNPLNPAGEKAVGVSADRLILGASATVRTSDNVSVNGHTVTLVPFSQVASASARPATDGTSHVTIDYAGERTFDATFDSAAQVERVMSALALRQDFSADSQPVTVGEKSSARAELLRLTGVELDETQAREALSEIHSFKWIAAEKAGFDTWAVIQPSNPLRAAAVHWVRKHFDEFHAFQRSGAGNHESVA